MVITHQYWACNARSSHVLSLVGAWYRGGLTDMGLLSDSTHAIHNILEGGFAEPKQTTRRMADKVVRAGGLAHFIILPQLQYELPVRRQGLGNLSHQLVDILNKLLDFPQQIRVTHVSDGIDWLETCLIELGHWYED